MKAVARVATRRRNLRPDGEVTIDNCFSASDVALACTLFDNTTSHSTSSACSMCGLTTASRRRWGGCAVRRTRKSNDHRLCLHGLGGPVARLALDTLRVCSPSTGRKTTRARGWRSSRRASAGGVWRQSRPGLMQRTLGGRWASGLGGGVSRGGRGIASVNVGVPPIMCPVACILPLVARWRMGRHRVPGYPWPRSTCSGGERVSACSRLASSSVRLSRMRSDQMPMSRLILVLLLLALGGCLSISSSNPPPPNKTTVVVPSGSTEACSNGAPPPCQ
jgi:hypothetical protein